jgi:hypothetical protein
VNDRLPGRRVEIVIQVNGKLHDRMKTSISATEQGLARRRPTRRFARIGGKLVRNVIVVPRKLVNAVV